MFISNAYAAEQTASANLYQFLPLIIIFGLFWLFVIAPQMKQTKAHRKMLQGLQKGDEIVTSGGISGKISQIHDHFIELEIATGIVVHVQKTAVQSMLPKGTLHLSK